MAGLLREEAPAGQGFCSVSLLSAEVSGSIRLFRVYTDRESPVKATL